MDLKAQLASILEEAPERLGDERTLRDIPTWDSMTHMVLVSRLEQYYQVEFSGDEIADFQTIGDIRQALRKRGKSQDDL